MRPPDTSRSAKRSPKGRPALPPEMKRSHIYEVAVNAGERAALDELARLRGLAPSAYLRDRGLGKQLPRAAPVDQFDAGKLDAINKLWLAASTLRRELAPVANNCNQLAHHANSGRFRDTAVQLAVQELSPLVERIRQIEIEATRLLQAATASDDR